MRYMNTRGSSLLYVMLILSVIFVIAFSISALATRELASTSVNQRSQQAFYAAEAGIERGMYELKQEPDTTSFTDSESSPEYLVRLGEAGEAEATDEQIIPLENFEMKEISLFNPDLITENLFSVSGDVTVTISCVGGPCADLNSGAQLQIATTSFNPSTLGGFDVNQLLDSTAVRSLSSEDETNIKLSETVASSFPKSLTLPSVGDTRYLLRLKALVAGGTYRVKFSSPFTPSHILALEAFGTSNDARRAIRILLDRNRHAKDIFQYVILENDDIEKFAQ